MAPVTQNKMVKKEMSLSDTDIEEGMGTQPYRLSYNALREWEERIHFY